MMRLRLGHENENRVLRMRLLGRRRRRKRKRRRGRETDNARLSHTNPKIWESTVRGWLPFRHMKSPWKKFPDSKSMRDRFLLAYAIQFLTVCYSSWNTLRQWAMTHGQNQISNRTILKAFYIHQGHVKLRCLLQNIISCAEHSRKLRKDNWRPCLHLSVFYPIISTCPTWKRGP